MRRLPAETRRRPANVRRRPDPSTTGGRPFLPVPVPEGYDPALDPAGALLAMGVPRSPQWPKVAADHLKRQPECAACGAQTALQVHHVTPFHVDPARELDPTNLLTLCACPSHNCHLIFGHLLRWDSWNVDVVVDAAAYLKKLTNRPLPE